MKRGNPDPVFGRRIDRGGIRDRVNGCDEEQQANGADGPFMFQIALNMAEEVPFRASATRIKNMLALHKGGCSTLFRANHLDVAAPQTVSNKVVSKLQVRESGRGSSAELLLL
jgi:hypothetical protein